MRLFIGLAKVLTNVGWIVDVFRAAHDRLKCCLNELISEMSRSIVGVERAGEGRRLLEPRLWGTWKSDRRKTFEHVHLPKATPEGLRKLRSIYGKLTVIWGRSTMSSYFAGKRFLGSFPNDETPTMSRYSLLARSRHTAVLLIQNDPVMVERSFGLFDAEMLMTIEFDDGGYWVKSPYSIFREYFRKVTIGKPSNRKDK